MPATDTWFVTTSGRQLEQGDVLHDVLLPRIVGAHAQRPVIDLDRVSGIVLTQSCDLARGKVDQVVLAAITSYRDYVHAEEQRGNSFVASRRFRRSVLDGLIPPLTVIPPNPAASEPRWGLADFRRLYTVPLSDLGDIAEQIGNRSRLSSPYREHLAQAFARFFMRVGLPTDAIEFETVDD